MTKQYNMSTDDTAKFKDIKESSLYKDYINSIVASPIFVNIANEHIKHIDITNDLDDILGKNNSHSKKLNTLFKDTLKNMAINMVADTLIIKDIIDVGFDDCLQDLENNFKVKYLLGLADEEDYNNAKIMIDNVPDTSSIAYIGYVEYQKRVNNKTLNSYKIEDIKPKKSAKTKVIKDTAEKTSAKTSKKSVVDISSNDIEF